MFPLNTPVVDRVEAVQKYMSELQYPSDCLQLVNNMYNLNGFIKYFIDFILTIYPYWLYIYIYILLPVLLFMCRISPN